MQVLNVKALKQESINLGQAVRGVRNKMHREGTEGKREDDENTKQVCSESPLSADAGDIENSVIKSQEMRRRFITGELPDCLQVF